ncbi:MAG: cytidine deaminase [Pirellulales bacterium]
MQLVQTQLEYLAAQSIAARQKAYSPYSQFQVGAAILGADQKIYLGCNVENASYGLTICAERNAVFAMVAAGCREILAVSIALPGGGTPCGACRQVLVEFGRGFPVLIVDSTTGQVKSQWNIEDLLPAAFRPESLH